MCSHLAASIVSDFRQANFIQAGRKGERRIEYCTASNVTCIYKAKLKYIVHSRILLDFSLTEKAVTLIFISGCGSAISSAKVGKSGFIYNLVKS